MSALPESPVWHERSAREHEAILNAVREQDRDAAARRWRRTSRIPQKSVEALLSAARQRPVDRRDASDTSMDSLQVL